MTILEVQQILAQLGFRPGPVDGVWGRMTAAAVRAFQESYGLEPDGIVGPVTSQALAEAADGPQASSFPLVWYEEAARQFGTREVPGPASNHTILDWAKGQGIPYRSDDIPWCGLFVAHCIGSTLAPEPIPGAPLRARAWERFGIACPPCKGAVLVFWRKSLQSGLGHVGFYAGENKTAFRVLGGNQSNEVSLAWIAKDRLLASRWPSMVPPVFGQPIKVAQNDIDLSVNEA